MRMMTRLRQGQLPPSLSTSVKLYLGSKRDSGTRKGVRNSLRAHHDNSIVNGPLMCQDVKTTQTFSTSWFHNMFIYDLVSTVFRDHSPIEECLRAQHSNQSPSSARTEHIGPSMGMGISCPMCGWSSILPRVPRPRILRGMKNVEE